MRKEGVSIKDLMNRQAQVGQVTFISIRPERRKPPKQVESVFADAEHGLDGDHYGGGPGGKRQVTLISHEHLLSVASFMGEEALDPRLVRRNIVISGMNLLSLKDKSFCIGEAVLRTTGLCHPCSRMEENLGEGGYSAMRGHGGITAKIVSSGMIKQGDQLKMVEDDR